jgi:hypothetical protein
MPGTIISTGINLSHSTLGSIFKGIIGFVVWFYGTFLPFILQYIGIPLFLLGILLALGFAGGTMLFIIAFFIFMFFFIKGTIFNSTP